MDAKVLLIELETPIETALYAARIASESGVPVIINPSPQQTLPDELFSLATRHDVSHLGENIGLDGHVGVGASYYNYLTHNL